VHLREDRRHIKDRDLYILKEVVKSKLNLEMSVAQEIVRIALKVNPGQATLVPEKRREITTEGGLDVIANFKRIKQVLGEFNEKGIAGSLFIDPDKKQIDAAGKAGAGMVELHTGRYADAKNAGEQEKYFQELDTAVKYGLSKGLVVNAGHGLNYYNVSRVARIKGIEELNIGYAIVCRAVLAGLERAVREMKALAALK
jgi:pyridoxine 5-phosphate synthase